MAAISFCREGTITFDEMCMYSHCGRRGLSLGTEHVLSLRASWIEPRN